MIKLLKSSVVRSVLFLLLSASAYAAPVPSLVAFGSGYQVDISSFFQSNKFSGLIKYLRQGDPNMIQSQSILLGGYYRAFDFLKAGAFYRRSYGLRHDDDWVGGSGGWFWADSQSRGEDFLILDTTPRFHLPVPIFELENWVGEVKVRYQFNFFNQQQTLILRPGVYYYWLKDDTGFLSFFIQFENYIPLNYGQSLIYEKWLYLGLMHRIADYVQAGVNVSYHTETWGTSSSFASLTQQQYQVTSQSIVIGANVVFQF